MWNFLDTVILDELFTCVGFHVQSEVVLTFDSFGTHRTLVDISGPVY